MSNIVVPSFVEQDTDEHHEAEQHSKYDASEDSQHQTCNISIDLPFRIMTLYTRAQANADIAPF